MRDADTKKWESLNLTCHAKYRQDVSENPHDLENLDAWVMVIRELELLIKLGSEQYQKLRREVTQ